MGPAVPSEGGPKYVSTGRGVGRPALYETVVNRYITGRLSPVVQACDVCGRRTCAVEVQLVEMPPGVLWRRRSRGVSVGSYGG